MEEALHYMQLFQDFDGLAGWEDRLPDESTILRFRHAWEKHKLADQIYPPARNRIGVFFSHISPA